MCETCEKTLNSLSIRDYSTATGKKFRITGIVGSKIFFKNENGSERFIHRNHLLLCLHWLVEGKPIEGVGGSGSSIRSLIGENGSLIKCSLCERNVAYLWGILASIPMVSRRGNSLRVEKNDLKKIITSFLIAIKFIILKIQSQ